MNAEDLKRDFVEGKVHPLDLKMAIAQEINDLLEPVRRHFKQNLKARQMKQRIENYVKQYVKWKNQ